MVTARPCVMVAHRVRGARAMSRGTGQIDGRASAMDKRYCTECGYSIDDYAPAEEQCGACWSMINDPEPTCDVCGVGQYHSEHMEWNGDTGNHVLCELAGAL